MKHKRWSTCSGPWALGLIALLLSLGAAAAPPSPAMLANACASCHGTLGSSAGPAMPSLAGHSKDAIVTAMKEFKSGERPSTVMGRLAKGYSDADFAAMGDFFSSQKLRVTVQTLDPARVARGASLQAENCSRCHSENGKESTDDTPPMAGQWLPYMQMQMALYLSGARKMSDRMEKKIRSLSASDIDALLQFYASVK